MGNTAPFASALSSRAYWKLATSSAWEEIWEAGPYYSRISEILENARSYAVFVGWQVDSRLLLPRPGGGLERLREKMIRTCQTKPGFQIYFLMWDHSYFYLPERELWQTRVWEGIHERFHFVFDNHHPFGGSHHEKICIFDGRIALCGGIDLCDERWDSPQHLYFDPRRSLNWREENHGPYHDLAVQVTGPVCALIQEHVARRWRSLCSIPFPDSPPLLEKIRGGHSVYVSRTIPLETRFPRLRGLSPVREVEFLFRDLIRSAERKIILEGQYFWSRSIHDLLIAKMLENRGKPLEIYLILARLEKIRSPTRKMARYELSLLQSLETTARECGTRLILGAPYVFSGAPPRPVYIHSKLLIIDDRYLSIGSANFAARAFRLDTELQLTLEAKSQAERLHIRKFSQAVVHHWGISHGPGDLRLIPFRPARDLSEARSSGWLPGPDTGRIPWERVFDPPTPWLFSLKSAIEKGLRFSPRKSSFIRWIALLLAWFLVFITAFGSFLLLRSWVRPQATESPEEDSILLRSAAILGILTSSWILPLSLFAAAFIIAARLGVEEATLLATAAIWASSLMGYSLQRAFPSFLAPSPSPEKTRIGFENLGRRNLSGVLRLMANLRLSFREKIHFQGWHCIPLPWFLLASGLLFPAAFYVALRAAIALSPHFVIQSIRDYMEPLLFLILADAGSRAREFWRPVAQLVWKEKHQKR